MNHAPSYTAVELLKMNGNNFQRMDAPRLIRRLAIEKGWGIGDIKHLSRAGVFGHMVQLLLNREGQRNLNTATSGIYDFMGSTLENFEPAQNCETYKGHHLQNKRIDAALLTNRNLQSVGRGAATLFQASQISIPSAAKNVPIAIIGYGAAGIIVAYALNKTGFTNITVFEKANEHLGIWRQKNVFQRSRNNPRRIELLGNILEPAPGDGEEVKNFLEKMRISNYVKQATVTEIQPGSLNHTLTLAKGSDSQKLSVDSEQKFPIVINCIGLGKPKELTDPSRMTTYLNSGVQRWQQTLSREQINNKRFVFIGLGNSTAEMLRQVHAHMDVAQGAAVDYRILTHYPKDAIFNPDEYVPYGGQTYRVFRDLSQPNLVNFHGDLSEFRDDYFRALRTGRIISDVKHWDETSGPNPNLTIQISNRKKKKRELVVVPSDQTYALLGYKQPVDDLIALGCEYDSKSECPYYDYDGEFIKKHPIDLTDRFHRGYFGFGSVLEGKHNPNAMVIPGMTFRIGDLIFGVIMRAMEVARTTF